MRNLWQNQNTKTRALREWIIFALCLGLGGHVALAIVLHAPYLWALERSGLYGLLLGVSMYVAVQLGRSLWWLGKPDSSETEVQSEEQAN